MQALFFLLNAIAGFFAFLFLLRFLLQWLRVSFSGQLGHFVVTTTNWAVKPLRRVIPGWRGFDWASLLAAFVVQLALTVLVVILNYVFSKLLVFTKKKKSADTPANPNEKYAMRIRKECCGALFLLALELQGAVVCGKIMNGNFRLRGIFVWQEHIRR